MINQQQLWDDDAASIMAPVHTVSQALKQTDQ
ncbi:hypothetical protein ABIE35_001915 [Paenarthrobacter sp. 4246]